MVAVTNRRGSHTTSIWRKHKYSLFEAGHHLYCYWTSMVLFLGPLDLDWNVYTSLPKHPCFRLQNVLLFSLHNHLSQFLTINFLLYIYLSFIYLSIIYIYISTYHLFNYLSSIVPIFHLSVHTYPSIHLFIFLSIYHLSVSLSHLSVLFSLFFFSGNPWVTLYQIYSCSGQLAVGCECTSEFNNIGIIWECN
jgi:hypothetical protein